MIRFGISIVGIATICGLQKPATPKPVSVAPLQYYQAKCARCHGDYGANYGADLAAHRKDARLITDVDRMARGPGGCALAGTDLDAQVAFHRSLVVNQPFLVWTFRSGNLVKGEVTMGSKVAARQKGKTLKVQQSGTDWSIEATTESELRITATKGKASTVLDLSQSSFSHAAPLKR